ncbi:hypothetical protein BJX61DRAFT_547875 [Aspergillus egyptiacus]|nr:hypothetical protein BJX61DRAFT_547875 [Aspergillus egyptiacus]
MLAPYLTEDWPTQPAWVTRTLAPGHEFHIQMLPPSEEAERAMLQIKGTFDKILDILEQFSWLTATLRPCKGGELTVSEIKAEFSGSDQLLLLSLVEQTAERMPDPKEAGQCWTSLFTESNLAYGFPSRSDTRPDEMLGLDVPFDVMAAFSRVEYPILFEDKIILAGNSTLLTPMVSSAGCIQWHFTEGKDRFESSSQRTKVLDSNLRTMGIGELTSARAFLGFASEVEIHLGTKYVPGAEITDSRAPRSRVRLQILQEGPMGLEVGLKGLKTTVGGTWKLRKGEQAQKQGEYRSLIDYIQPARYAPVLLYDYEAARAFLMPELSVILHMFSAYLRSCSSLPQDQIPCAQPSANSGEAAFEIIKENQELNVTFTVGESRKYRDIIHDFIHIWEQRRSQTRAAQSEPDFRFKAGIRGWDFIDMQNKQYEFLEREISASRLPRQGTPVWWEMFSKQPCMVIFAGNVGCPIRKAAHCIGQPYCNAWADLPTGEHLLLAQLSSLLTLSQTFVPRSKPNSKYHMITDKLAWARPKGSILFEPCSQGAGGTDSCTPVQTMRKVGGWHSWDKGHDRTPGDILPHANGAVLFADNPKDFGRRSCVFALPEPPDPAPPILVLPQPSPVKKYDISVISCVVAGCFGFVFLLSIL